ncbi:hypothetical protein TNIN_144491 [Trichonephila inaurata madagascariensis]|uniref:Uncharacterized protein n=1 Tax=Trichonephila inaurata madagascariensis TaxID=2747483 RepID=A0A8X6ICR7_9ARAC|nr:hypothetical protein TNIN_144491 [Trichonephila inaurata madagascariensis]
MRLHCEEESETQTQREGREDVCLSVFDDSLRFASPAPPFSSVPDLLVERIRNGPLRASALIWKRRGEGEVGRSLLSRYRSICKYALGYYSVHLANLQ